MVKSCCAMLVMVASLPLIAVDYTWTGAAGNGKWQDAGNWSGGDGTAYPSVRPSAEVSGDTATFLSGEVTLTDSPANCGRVTVSAGAVVTAPFSGDITWHGLRGPGKFVKQGTGILKLCNDATDGCSLYGDIVFQAEAGGVGLTGDGGTSILVTSGDFSNAKVTPTIGDATIIMKNDANLSSGGTTWPGVYGTVTVDVEEGLSSGLFLKNTVYTSPRSKIIKIGKGTLNFNATHTSGNAKGSLEIREGEFSALVKMFEVTGGLSGSGVLNVTNFLVKGSNDLFTGTIAFRERGSYLKVNGTASQFALANATFDIKAPSCTMEFDTLNVRLFKPIVVPEGCSLTIRSTSRVHFFGLSGSGNVSFIMGNNNGLFYLYNRLEDRTGALGDGIHLTLGENCKAELNAAGLNGSYGNPICGDVDLAFASGAQLSIGAGAEFDDLTLGSNALVITKSAQDPLRFHGTLTAVVDGEAKPVLQPASSAFSGVNGSLALILSDTAFATDDIAYDLSQGGAGWSAYAYGNTRVYARSAGAANVWTGAANTISWGDAANWADGLPADGNVVLYGDDFERINVPADSGFTGTVRLRGTGDAAFSGAGLADVAFDCSKFTGRFVKRGTDTYLIPASCTPPTFVVAEGVAVKADGASGGKNIVVEAGAQFDFNGMNGSDPYPVFTIEGAGPDGSGALVNTGDAIIWNQSEIAGLVLSGDAVIGGTSQWGLLNKWRTEPVSVDLAGHTLTKVGGNTILFANLVTTTGTVFIAEGQFETHTAGSDLSQTTLKLGDGTTLHGNDPISVGTLVCGANVTAYNKNVTVVGELATLAAITFNTLTFADGATFAPNGTLTVSNPTFGEDLTLDLSNWTPASGRTLVKAPGVTADTFGTVVGLPKGFCLRAKDNSLDLVRIGLMLIFR